MAARKIGPPCNCKDKCFTRVSEADRNQIFNGFWASGNHNTQTHELQKRIIPHEVKRKRAQHNKITTKRYIYHYTVNVGGTITRICKKAFKSIYDVRDKRIKIAVNKFNEAGCMIPDQRGKNPKKWAFSQEVVNCVHEHIQQLPVQQSHYTRKVNKNRQYLSKSCSIKILYLKYLEWMNFYHKDTHKVAHRYYNKIFSAHYNIGFRKPRKDVCGACKVFKINLESAKQKNNTESIEKEWNDHKKKAAIHKKFMKAAKKKKNNTGSWKNICMDLQQTMNCPKLNVGMAYYKRKLSLHNFCINDLPLKESYMYVWEENVAARGTVEIFSCLKKYLTTYVTNTPNYPRNLRIFCDNCGGQNKSFKMIVALLREIHIGTFDRIELCYLVPGHSYMPCDVSFGHVEKFLNRFECIFSPDDFCEKIEHAVENGFSLYHMEREDFLDIEIMKKRGLVQYRQVKNKAFQTAAQIIVKSENPNGYYLKSNYRQEDSEAVFVDVIHYTNKTKKLDLSNVELPLKYPHERHLDPKKMIDLKNLLPYMGDYCQWILDLEKRQKQIPKTSATTSTYVEDENTDDDEDKALEDDEYNLGDRNLVYVEEVIYNTRSKVTNKN